MEYGELTPLQADPRAIPLPVARIAGVSHDMNTPLATITSALDLLEEPSTTAAEAAHLFAVLRRQVTHLSHFANDLRDAARLASGPASVSLQPFNLTELAGQLVQEAALVEEREVVLHAPDGPLMITSDPHAVRRIMENLISNALKYSKPGTSVTVRTGSHEAGPLLMVEDEGAQLSPDVMTALRQPYVRGSHDGAGQGLGLFIVAALADALGAHVWVEPTELGSRFCVLLNNGQSGGGAGGQSLPAHPAGTQPPAQT